MNKKPTILVALDISGSFSHTKSRDGEAYLQSAIDAISRELSKNEKNLEIFSWGDENHTGAISITSDMRAPIKEKLFDTLKTGFDCAGYAETLIDHLKQKFTTKDVKDIVIIGDGDAMLNGLKNWQNILDDFASMARAMPDATFNFLQINDFNKGNRHFTNFDQMTKDLQKMGVKIKLTKCEPNEIGQAFANVIRGQSFISPLELSKLRSDFAAAQDELAKTKKQMQGIYQELRETKDKLRHQGQGHHMHHGQRHGGCKNTSRHQNPKCRCGC
jgi:hypothetical protein